MYNDIEAFIKEAREKIENSTDTYSKSQETDYLKKELADKADMLDKGNIVRDDIDWRLAFHIYNFLNGKTNRCPSYDLISEVVDSTDDFIISMGYGIIVYNDFSMRCSEMITEKLERNDIIKLDSYEAYVIGSNMTEIDVNKEPRFDLGRVAFLQNHLKKYINRKVK